MDGTWYNGDVKITSRGNYEIFRLGGVFVLLCFFCYAVALYSPAAYSLVMSLNLAGCYL